MEHDLITLPDPASLATRAAGFLAQQARAAVADHGAFTFAVSGGATPWAMFVQLANEDVPWEEVEIFQVDERV
ncbi:MAG: 6-phosphogluconolactonase, partial [Acidimicrobiales bacterium]